MICMRHRVRAQILSYASGAGVTRLLLFVAENETRRSAIEARIDRMRSLSQLLSSLLTKRVKDIKRARWFGKLLLDCRGTDKFITLAASAMNGLTTISFTCHI